MPLEPSYQRALEALAKACMVYRDLTGRDVVLVGGAATAIYSSGLAQYSAGSVFDTSRLEQARALFRLADGLDIAYLSKRVHDEGGDLGLLEL
jgi:hypothetical protein